MADWKSSEWDDSRTRGRDEALESDLRAALRHVPAPEGFAERVLARAAEGRVRQVRRTASVRQRTLAGLLAASVAVAGGLGVARLRHRDAPPQAAVAGVQGGAGAVRPVPDSSEDVAGSSHAQTDQGDQVAQTDAQPPTPPATEAQAAQADAQLRLAMTLTQHAIVCVSEDVNRSPAGRYTRVVFGNEANEERP